MRGGNVEWGFVRGFPKAIKTTQKNNKKKTQTGQRGEFKKKKKLQSQEKKAAAQADGSGGSRAAQVKDDVATITKKGRSMLKKGKEEMRN